MKQFALVGLLLAASVTSAYAQSNLRFLHDTPIGSFKKADTDLMFKTLHAALDTGEDGIPVTWERAVDSNSGSITPSKDPANRAACRMVQVESRHLTLYSKHDAVFCKKNGKWNLAK